MACSLPSCKIVPGVARLERGSVCRVSTGFDSRTPEGMSRTCTPASVSRTVVNYPSSPNFDKHTENLNAVRATLIQVERAHKRAIGEGDEPAERAIRKVHTLLLGVFARAPAKSRFSPDPPIGGGVGRVVTRECGSSQSRV